MEVRRLGNGWPDDQKYDLREEFHEECDMLHNYILESPQQWQQ